MQIYLVAMKIAGVRQTPPAPGQQAVNMGGNEMHLTVGREKMDLLADFPGVLQGGVPGWLGWFQRKVLVVFTNPCSEGKEVLQAAHPHHG